MSSLDPAATGDSAETRCPSQETQPGDHVNPLIAGPVDQITEAPPVGPCHDAADCPDEATVAVTAAELARLGELLTEIDAFLRCGNGVAGKPADFYAVRGHPHPRFAAANLIDAVCFTAPGLCRRGQTGDHEGERR